MQRSQDCIAVSWCALQVDSPPSTLQFSKDQSPKVAPAVAYDGHETTWPLLAGKAWKRCIEIAPCNSMLIVFQNAGTTCSFKLFYTGLKSYLLPWQ